MYSSGKFYRIESAHGLGPYACFKFNQIFRSIYFDLKLRPSPFYDEGLKHFWRSIGDEKFDFQFGFKNKTQLKKWFTPSLIKNIHATSIEKGLPFFVSAYDARMVIGETQAMAKKKDLKLIARTPIGEFK